MYHQDVHKVANDFLKTLERGTAYREERLEVVPVSLTIGKDLVALKRKEAPNYFCGFKPSGRPIFTHDLRLAKSFEAQCMTLAAAATQLVTIGIEITLHPTVWYEGRHHTEL
jgi:hypothetical protein